MAGVHIWCKGMAFTTLALNAIACLHEVHLFMNGHYACMHDYTDKHYGFKSVCKFHKFLFLQDVCILWNCRHVFEVAASTYMLYVHACFQIDTCKFAWVQIHVWVHDMSICLCSKYNLSPAYVYSLGANFAWSRAKFGRIHLLILLSTTKANWDTSFHRQHLQRFQTGLWHLALFI